MSPHDQEHPHQMNHNYGDDTRREKEKKIPFDICLASCYNI